MALAVGRRPPTRAATSATGNARLARPARTRRHPVPTLTPLLPNPRLRGCKGKSNALREPSRRPSPPNRPPMTRLAGRRATTADAQGAVERREEREFGLHFAQSYHTSACGGDREVRRICSARRRLRWAMRSRSRTAPRHVRARARSGARRRTSMASVRASTSAQSRPAPRRFGFSPCSCAAYAWPVGFSGAMRARHSCGDASTPAYLTV